jgi:hypothetical protein
MLRQTGLARADVSTIRVKRLRHYRAVPTEINECSHSAAFDGCVSRCRALPNIFKKRKQLHNLSRAKHSLDAARTHVRKRYCTNHNASRANTSCSYSSTTRWNFHHRWCRVLVRGPISLALAAGATCVARGFSGEQKHLTELIKQGIGHAGFSFLDVFSPCVT